MVKCRISVLIFAVFFLSCGAKKNESKTNNSRSRVFSIENIQIDTGSVEKTNGLSWGRNKSKIVHSDDKVFTYTLSEGAAEPYSFELIEYDVKTFEYRLGATIISSRSPDLLRDSNGFIHVIAFEPFQNTNVYDGKFVHYKFDQANTISSTYQIQDAGSFLPLGVAGRNPLNSGSIYSSAVIDNNDYIYLVFNSTNSFFQSPGSCQTGAVNAAGPHSITLNTFNGATWSSEIVTNNLATRAGYPRVVLGEEHIFIYAVEDSFSSELNEDLLRCDLPFVFGQAWVFQRSKLSSPGPGNWNHHTPINLHQSLSLSEVFDLKFRVEDMVLVNGELVMLYSHNHEEVASELGIEFIPDFYTIRSNDLGENWSTPRLLLSQPTSPFGLVTISAKLLVDGENVYSQFISIDIENTVFPNQIESVEGVVNLNSRESKNIKLNDFNAYSLYSTQKGEGSIEANYWWTLKAPTSQVTSDHGPIIQKLTVDF